MQTVFMFVRFTSLFQAHARDAGSVSARIFLFKVMGFGEAGWWFANDSIQNQLIRSLLKDGPFGSDG